MVAGVVSALYFEVDRVTRVDLSVVVVEAVDVPELDDEDAAVVVVLGLGSMELISFLIFSFKRSFSDLDIVVFASAVLLIVGSQILVDVDDAVVVVGLEVVVEVCNFSKSLNTLRFFLITYTLVLSSFFCFFMLTTTPASSTSFLTRASLVG